MEKQTPALSHGRFVVHDYIMDYGTTVGALVGA